MSEQGVVADQEGLGEPVALFARSRPEHGYDVELAACKALQRDRPVAEFEHRLHAEVGGDFSREFDVEAISLAAGVEEVVGRVVGIAADAERARPP